MNSDESPRKRADAVALRYNEDKEKAPRVLAKGSGTVAEHILQLARENGIPLYEDKDLLELLAVLDLDQEIPPSLYRALAEILAFVYRANSSMK